MRPYCNAAWLVTVCTAMPLKILLIDSDADRAHALEQNLSQSGFAEVRRTTGGAGLAEAVESAKPDLIIFDMALPDRDALEDIRAVSAAHPIAMFAGNVDPAFAEEAIAAEVCSYNLSGVALADVQPVMTSAIALFRRYRKVEEELAAAKAMLEERRLIERAKAILMQDRKMTEPEAYRWLQKKAMNENRKLAKMVAEFIEQHGARRAAATADRKRP
jgi:two-component system, response regulator / RNA-binding antiterminator